MRGTDPLTPHPLSLTFFIPVIMRKIEKQMASAIANRSNWSQSNTSVSIDNEGNTFVTLHGNLIATIFNNGDMKLSSCGWQTVTTKSRLNAILDVFFHNVRIVQKQFEWYIDGDSFFDGYTIIR